MNLALFDFDGTITTGDTFTPFLRFAIGRRRAILGGLLVSPVVIANRLRMISTTKTRPIVARVGFQGAVSQGDEHFGTKFFFHYIVFGLHAFS